METKEKVTVLNTGVLALTQALKQQQDEIEQLKMQLAQAQHKEEPIIETKKVSRKKRIVTQDDNIYNPYKSNGVIKAKAAESIRSYSDFIKMQKYFWNKGRIRDWCLWTVGIGLGVRISDLLSLQFKNILDMHNNFYPRILMYEKKTGKMANLLLTEAVVNAFTVYFNSINWEFDYNDFIFSSNKGKGKEPMAPEYAWRIISSASRSLRLPIHVGSHTMRKSFANIVACVDTSVIDMNTIVKVQGLLNHSDQKTTMRYLGTFQAMYDKARNIVSEFILGRTQIKQLIVRDNSDTLWNCIDQIKGG